MLEAAGEDGLTTRELSAGVNLGLGRLEAMLKVLDVEGAVDARRARAGAACRAAAGATTPSATAAVTELRRAEQRAMAAFGADGRCLMRALQEELDDPDAAGLRALLGLRRPALRRARPTPSSSAPPRRTCARSR